MGTIGIGFFFFFFLPFGGLGVFAIVTSVSITAVAKVFKMQYLGKLSKYKITMKNLVSNSLIYLREM